MRIRFPAAPAALVAAVAALLAQPPRAAAQFTQDSEPPVVTIDPATSTRSSPTVTVTITWEDNAFLTASSRSITLNGTSITSGFSYDASGSFATSSGTITLASGTNTLTASIRDAANNLGTKTVTYTFATSSGGGTATHSPPRLSLASHHPGYVNTNLGAAARSYATPAYVSMDQPHAVTLVYNSTQARGTGFVQVDATDSSSTAPVKMSIQVYGPSGAAMTNETFYGAANGANRLAATWTTTTSANVYRIVVRSYFGDGAVLSSETSTRVLVLNEQASPFGAG